VAVCVTAAMISSAAASKIEKIDELVGLHDLKTRQPSRQLLPQTANPDCGARGADAVG
jgi:hypothetical protein